MKIRFGRESGLLGDQRPLHSIFLTDSPFKIRLRVAAATTTTTTTTAATTATTTITTATTTITTTTTKQKST